MDYLVICILSVVLVVVFFFHWRRILIEIVLPTVGALIGLLVGGLGMYLVMACFGATSEIIIILAGIISYWLCLNICCEIILEFCRKKFSQIQKKQECIVMKIIHVFVLKKTEFLDQNTLDIILDWLNGRASRRNEGFDRVKVECAMREDFEKQRNSKSFLFPEQYVQELYKYIKIADQYANVKKVTVHKGPCVMLHVGGNISEERYLFMQLFLKLATSLGDILDDDIQFLDYIARKLKVNKKTYKELKSKYLNLPSNN